MKVTTVGSFPRHTPQPTIEDESEAARVKFSTICAAPCEAGTVQESTLGLAQGLQARAVAGRLLDMLDRELDRVGPHLHQLLVQVSLVEADVDGVTSGHHVVVVDYLQSDKD